MEQNKRKMIGNQKVDFEDRKLGSGEEGRADGEGK